MSAKPNSVGLVQVPSFRTSDGNLHESKLTALTEQRKLDIRAILQSDARVGKGQTLTHTDATLAIISNYDAITNTCRKFQIAINRERSRVNKVN